MMAVGPGGLRRLPGPAAAGPPAAESNRQGGGHCLTQAVATVTRTSRRLGRGRGLATVTVIISVASEPQAEPDSDS